MQSSPAPLPALLPDYEREKLDAEMPLNKAAYGACLRHGVSHHRSNDTGATKPL
ncbi:MAG TPA: hypothetical protein VIT00_09110 [Terrimicrobiaceae bacterium]